DLNAVYQNFEIPVPGALTPNPQVSVVTYSSFFRVLYNASYLTRDDSQKALALLAGVDYKDGLVAGVPASVPIAHKFGERETTGDTTKQLNDCGIVYYPSHPYLLCVMTRGDSMPVL